MKLYDKSINIKWKFWLEKGGQSNVVTKRGGGKLKLQEVVKYMRCNPMIMRNPPPRRGPSRNSQSRWDLRTAETSFKGMQYYTKRQNTSQKNFR